MPDNPILTRKDRELFRRAVKQASQISQASPAQAALDAAKVAGDDTASVHADEKAAFVDAMKGVRPLRVDRAVAVRKLPRPLPLPHRAVADDPLPSYTGFVFSRHEEVADWLWFARPGLQNQVLRKLRRGRLPPEGEVDLHGMRIAEAHDAVEALLREARALDVRRVRIIHGKGNRTESPRGVLKAMVDRLLRSRDEVLAFSSAPAEQGGSGAVLVLLRR